MDFLMETLETIWEETLTHNKTEDPLIIWEAISQWVKVSLTP